MHDAADGAPGLGQTVPAGQGVHNVPPRPAIKVPLGQTWHEDAPEAADTVPTPHAVHDEAPATDEK